MVSPTGPSTRRQLTPAQSLSPATLRRLLRELNTLASAPPEGIRLAKETLGDEDGEGDMSDVRAWVEGPVGTPYAGELRCLDWWFSEEIGAGEEERLGGLSDGVGSRMRGMRWMGRELQLYVCTVRALRGD